MESTASDLPLWKRFLAQARNLYLLITDESGHLREVNDAAADRLGHGRRELLGREIWPWLSDHDADHLRRLLEGGGGPTEQVPLSFLNRSGMFETWRCWLETRPGELVILGEPTWREEAAYREELVRLNNDLAVLSREHARRGRTLERALGELRSAQATMVHREKMASLGQMTAGIAHELNNPLAYLLSNQDTLRRDFEALLSVAVRLRETLGTGDTPSPADVASLRAAVEGLELDYLEVAVPRKLGANVDGLSRISGLVSDLRTFSRLDEAERKTWSLSENLASVLRFLRPLLDRHQVDVVVELPDLLPLEGSPAALNQALTNIITNAVQASRPGQSVRISAQADAAELKIVVEDSGTGIAEEHLPRLGEPFFTTKPVGEGTGLGLSIVHQIVTAHGGQIEFQSTLGAGTRVVLCLPAPQVQRRGAVPSEGSHRVSTSTNSSSRKGFDK